jgi:hypothetical protein
MLVRPGRNASPVWIEEFTRQEFLEERWLYRPGEHTTIIAPTDWGKSTFTTQLLAHTVEPDLPVVRIALKPKDKTMTAAVKEHGWPIIRDFPPVMWNKSGYTWWPRHTGDADADDERFANELRQLLAWCYLNASKGRRRGIIVDGDEIEEIQNLLQSIGKGKMLRALYRRMRSSGGGIWGGCQAPKWLITDAYSQARHLFLGNDPDEKNQERFGEIGGVDPKLVQAAVVQLPQYHWLYLRRTGRVMCIVGP